MVATESTSAPIVAARSRGATAAQSTNRRFIALISLIGAIYLITATWSPPYNVDAYTNILQSHSFASDQNPIVANADHLFDDKYQGNVVWLVESPDGPTSQYPPGVALWGAGFYLLDTSMKQVDATFVTDEGQTETVTLPVPSFAPAALAAVAATTLAMLFLGLTLRAHMSETAMLACVAAAAFGTGAWSVAADMLWQHSPGMMVIAAGVYLASRDRLVGSGFAFAAAIVIRPHTALIAAGLGAVLALRRRSLEPLAKIGGASALGMTAVVSYNWHVWGEPSVTGGYGSGFTDNAKSTSPFTLVWRIWETLTHLDHGVIVLSPFLLLAFVALFGRCRGAPDWALGAAVGGAIYMLVQLQANRASGGYQFFGYRYPLEPLMAAAPLLAISAVGWARSQTRRVAMAVAVAVAIAIHSYGAV